MASNFIWFLSWWCSHIALLLSCRSHLILIAGLVLWFFTVGVLKWIIAEVYEFRADLRLCCWLIVLRIYISFSSQVIALPINYIIRRCEYVSCSSELSNFGAVAYRLALICVCIKVKFLDNVESERILIFFDFWLSQDYFTGLIFLLELIAD